MVRDSRYWPNVYFGRPGALTTLPWPRGGVDRPYEKLVSEPSTLPVSISLRPRHRDIG